MVTIKNFKTITKSDGEKFYALIVQGGVEPVKSQKTGKMYFTARTSTVPTTFDEKICKSVLGTHFNGEVRKVECKPYEYTIEATGEMLTLSHRWEYVDDDLQLLTDHVVSQTATIM